LLVLCVCGLAAVAATVIQNQPQHRLHNAANGKLVSASRDGSVWLDAQGYERDEGYHIIYFGVESQSQIPKFADWVAYRLPPKQGADVSATWKKRYRFSILKHSEPTKNIKILEAIQSIEDIKRHRQSLRHHLIGLKMNIF